MKSSVFLNWKNQTEPRWYVILTNKQISIFLALFMEKGEAMINPLAKSTKGSKTVDLKY